MLFTAVIPCYNEEENIKDIYDAILENEPFFKERDIEVEILYVDDGSKDGTKKEIQELSKKDSRVKMVSFSRNFGKEAAIYAGLENSNGDYVAIMDADLQDPPSLLPKMFEIVLDEGYDSAATRRVSRKGEPPIRSLFARMFYIIMRRISATEIMDGARDFRLMTKQMTRAILDMKEYNRFSKGIFGWVGFDTKWIEFENVKRRKGETKWSFGKLFVYSIEGIVGFSTMPLSIASFIGLLFCALSFIALIFIFVRALVFGDPVAGWPSLVCIITLASGVQMLSLGIIGKYLAKVYLEVKNRPIYIVKDRI